MNSVRCRQCEHYIEANAGKGKIYGCDRSKCVFEPTTKNDLEVDCISRADAIKAIEDKAKKLTNEDTINGLCGAVAILYELPPVKPQEPRWIPVSEGLPDPGVILLVTDDAGGLATVSTDAIYENEVTGEKEWYSSQNVTAWMPSPKPYREVKE